MKNRVWMVAAIAALIVFASSAMAAPAFQAPQFFSKFGGASDGSASTATGRFVGIGQGGVATSPNGQYVYVADNSGSNPLVTHRIQKFDATSGAFILSWGGPGTADGQFNLPNGVTVDSAGNVYVVDFASGGRVQKFDSNGNFLLKWYAPQGGYIAAGPDGNIYTDYGNNAVAKWDMNGNLLLAFGSGFGLTAARGIAFDSAGNLWVRDTVTGVISKFDPATGANLPNGVSGAGSGGSLAIDSHDRIHVGTSTPGDPTTAYVRVFNPNVVPAAQVGIWGSYCDLSTGTGCLDPDGTGSLVLGDGQFKNAPSSLFVSGEFLYAGDSFNRRVERFHVGFSPVLSACAQEVMTALGASADAFPESTITALESACTASQVMTVSPDATQNGTMRLDAGDVVALGTDSRVNGTTTTTVEGSGSGMLFMGSGVQVNGDVKNVGSVYVIGSVTVTGRLIGIGTLYYLPGSSLATGGSVQASQTVYLP